MTLELIYATIRYKAGKVAWLCECSLDSDEGFIFTYAHICHVMFAFKNLVVFNKIFAVISISSLMIHTNVLHECSLL